METVKIVFDIDTKDVKTSTQELQALNKVTNEEVASLNKLGAAAEDAGDGFVSLRTQVKQAKEEAQKAADKYGEFSKEANAARIKAGALADQMGDLNRQVNLLNPEAKAKAFSNLAQGVVGAFSVATGALQAFGVKNKEVEALAMKLQGALNITQGIASIGALKESFTDLKIILGFTTGATGTLTAAQKTQALSAAQATLGTATLTAAQEAEAIAAAEAAAATKGFTASLLTNPIFLVIAAIGALAAAYMTLNDETKTAILNEQELADAKKKTTELKNKEKQTAIDLLVANKEITKQEGERRKIEAKRVEDSQDLIKKLADLDKEEKKNLQTIKEKTQRGEELSKSARESAAIQSASAFNAAASARDANKQIVQSRKVTQDQLDTINKTASNETKQQDIDELNSKDDLNKKTLASNEATAAKNKQIRDKEAADKQKAFQDELNLIKLRQKNQVDEADTSEEKLALQQQFAVENYQLELNNLIQNKATATELQTLWETYYNTRLGLIAQQDKAVIDSCEKQLKAEKDFIDKMNAIAAKEVSPFEKIQAENDAIDTAYAEQYAAAVANGNDTTALNNAYLGAVQTQQEKLTKIIAEEAKKQTDITAKQQADRLSQLRDYGNGAADVLQFITDSVVQGDAAAREQELAQLEDQKNKKIISEEEYQKRLKAIKQKQAEDAKRAAIYNATLDLSRAIIAALTIPPPGSVIAANFAAAVAGLNLARIIATPIPKFQKGTLAVPGIDMGRDSVHAMLQPGEAVIPVSTNRAYHPTIKAIYEKKISASEINSFVMNKTSSGGRQSITANVDTYALGKALGKNKGVQIENAQVVGKVIANELNNYNVRRGW